MDEAMSVFCRLNDRYSCDLEVVYHWEFARSNENDTNMHYMCVCLDHLFTYTMLVLRNMCLQA